MWIVMYVATAASASAMVMWLTLAPWTDVGRVGLQRQVNRVKPPEDDWA
jgi:hypothetical protein